MFLRSGLASKPEQWNCVGERARLGRRGPRPRGPLGARKPVHCLVHSFAPVFGARARRTAAEAAAVPSHSNCIGTAKAKKARTMKTPPGRRNRSPALVVLLLCFSLFAHRPEAAVDATHPSTAETFVLPKSVPDPIEPLNR